MKCANCNVSGEPMGRVNELGVDGIWWCFPCIENNEPELYKNHKEDCGDIIEAITGQEI